MLKELGYEKVVTYSNLKEYISKNGALEAFTNYDQLVNAKWLKDAMDGKKPESLKNDKLIVLEAGWGPEEKAEAYNKGHIKGAIHFNTDWIENNPIWNLSAPEVVQKNLEAIVINESTSVVVYSSDAYAAGRVYFALKAFGLKDVKILNGGLDAWNSASFELSKDKVTPTPAKFAKPISLDRTIGIETAKEAYEKQTKEGFKLVSIRSWDEYSGKTSGYDYMPTMVNLRELIRDLQVQMHQVCRTTMIQMEL